MKENIKIILLALVVLIIIIYNFITKLGLFDKSEELSVENSNILVSESSNSNAQNEKTLEETPKIKIYITGEVVSPGVYELEENSRVEDAIHAAGGLTDKAILTNVNLAYVLEDASKIYIPNSNDNEISEVITNGMSNTTSMSKNQKININKANAQDLENVPGIGPSTAEKIITYRNENGKFSSIDDLKNVTGIGEKKFESIKDYISV